MGKFYLDNEQKRHRSAGADLQLICAFVVCIFKKHDAAHMSLVVRKPFFCMCEKDADHLCGSREADQRLCFRYMDSTIPLVSKSKISSL